MREPIYRLPGTNVGFTPEIIDAAHGESISLFDTPAGSQIELDVAFDDDAQRTGRLIIEVVEQADRGSWDRGSFRILEAELPFQPQTGEWAGRTGVIDAAITYRRGLVNPLSLGHVAHIDKGRHLVMHVIVPDNPKMANSLLPFVLNARLIPQAEQASQS